MSESMWVGVLVVAAWVVTAGLLGIASRSDRRIERILRDRYRGTK